jgi:hypothetical protein
MNEMIDFLWVLNKNNSIVNQLQEIVLVFFYGRLQPNRLLGLTKSDKKVWCFESDSL